MKLQDLKETITQVLRERSINAISKLQQKNLDDISKALEFYKKNKHTDKKEPFIKLLKKLGKEKEALAKELDMKVSGMYKNAEYKGESIEESINEGPSTEEKRIAMLAVRKQAKYRSVSLEQAIQDQINALEELKRDAKRGKLGESVNEASSEPQIITQLRDVVKNGYKTLKDPKTGKKMKVDSYSASAITQVYDAIKNPSTKDKFVKSGLLGMQSVSFKAIRK
jgi:hypothetical protein